LSSSYLFQQLNQPKHDDNMQHLPVFRRKRFQIKRARSQTCLGSRPVPVKNKGEKKRKKPWWPRSIIITAAIVFKSKIKGYAETVAILTEGEH